MRKTLSLLLALLMVVAAVPVFGIVALAAGESGNTPNTTYSIYRQDFESLNPETSKKDLLQALGWFVPAGKAGDDIADYSVVTVGTGKNANKVLRISTKAPGGIDSDSFVTIFDGNPMSIVRNGNFTLSYQLTYRSGTTNMDGYSSVIYNYNGENGTVSTDGAATYGIVAIRASGTGFNGVYYPVSSGSTMALIEDAPGSSWMSMGNRFTKTGEYPSLYARLFLDDAKQEAADTVLSGSDVMIDETLNVRLEYRYLEGVQVYVNDLLVSETTGNAESKYSNASTWNDFVTRTSGTSVAILTKSGVVADIDNISITTDSLKAAETRDLPELLITEIAPSGFGATINGVGYWWNEYIEIYNPTDHPIDLRDYSICYSDYTFDGAADDAISDGGRMTKYASYLRLDTVIGKPVESNANYYYTADDLRALCTPEDLEKVERGEYNNLSRFRFVDADTDFTKGTRYVKNGTSYKADAKGELIKIKYVERWNERYQPGKNYDDNGNPDYSNYNENTLINPGSCVLIYTILDSTKECWIYGVNAGENSSTNISDSISFRQSYKSKGLGTKEGTSVKVIAERNFNLADSECRRYYIAKAYDDAGKEINYKERYVTDLSDVVCYADFVSPLVAGIVNGGKDPADTSTLGNAGVHEGGYSGVYVYGADASGDFRGGTLYIGRNKVSSSNHVGLLAGYQKIMFDTIYNNKKADLAITEIAPRTLNLKGEDKSAFSAMEVTNTSSFAVDLYQYAIVRNELGAACNYGKGFTRVVELRPGNPVNKGKNNGAYYYFVDEYISNPDTCVLAPGESAVLWFLSHDTYACYARDEDFGVDYFRQYWASLGNSQLAVKDGDGNYVTKVIAVDGNSTATYNRDNADKVLDLSYTSSAVYGIAKATENVLANIITAEDVINVAYLGQISTYYNLHEEEQTISGVTYVYQALDYLNIPANGSMHYIPGSFGSASGMAKSMKVQFWAYDGNKKNFFIKEERDNAQFKVRLITNYAMQNPDLGGLHGKEALGLAENSFYPVYDTDGNVTYYYYNNSGVSVTTLSGAGLNTVGETAKLRFDNAVPVEMYNALAATYGAENLKVGVLVTETSKVPAGTLNRSALDRAGVAYTDVVGRALYRTPDFAVIGCSMEVDAANYGTSYTAVGYLEVTLASGAVKTFWSSATATGNVRNVAQKSLDDYRDFQDETYRYDLGMGYYFSRYSDAERETLQRFCA